ncbi:16S rRNA (guanine(527)-N(7))-methyltransferase RsmG [Halomonas denitrificans]|nr:16S rRNA (guanine(527)-N(7))-methyltransferase RsmG [Halomonas denitrificans]
MPDRTAAAFDADAILDRLQRGASALGQTIPDPIRDRLVAYLAELVRWNAAYNLTALKDPLEMVDRHLVDSLSLRPHLEGSRILDAGTGAGLPGLVLAIAEPDRRFVLVDSNGKKVRFLRHVQRSLGLTNVEAVHGRLEALDLDPPPDELTARALAPLPRLVEWLAPWIDAGAPLKAMKADLDPAERDGLPDGYSLELRPLAWPGQSAARTLAVVRRRSRQ